MASQNNDLDGATLDERSAVATLVSDLHWQVDQMNPRGIKDAAGNPYNPSYYKRGLQAAIKRGGLAVPEFVLRYVHKPPSDGYQKLEAADSLDLACEALVADADKPYAHLFSEDDRALARGRLEPFLAAIEKRKTDRLERIERRRAELPGELEALKSLAGETTEPEDAIAVNSAIVDQAPGDVVALNRLGRAYESIGSHDQAVGYFKEVLAADPGNTIATRRLRDLERHIRRVTRA